jgi:hypothetical protein
MGHAFQAGVHGGNLRVPLHIPIDAEQAIEKACFQMDGMKYDWFGVLRFIFPIPLKIGRDRRFCSEAVTQALQAGGILDHVPSIRVSPNGLWLIAEAMRKQRERDAAIPSNTP